jgi:hypothetical protein
MSGNRLTAFAAMLIAGVVAMGVMCITCTIGQIVVTPYFGVLTAMIYLMATGQPHSAKLASSLRP